MKIGSLFDGSGGFPLAATMCGIEPVWAAEVEPYPIAVTRSRFPNMKHLGSVTDIHGGEIEPVDVITFGSPCQDLSVAGKRAGLKHTENGDDETTRSGLFMEAVRIIKEMRKATNGEYPRYAVWENVPGAFSSNKGLDFRVVLEELIRIAEPTAVMPEVPKAGWPYADVYCGDGWSLAYRVLDAQYWGVPQRRRRIYLVADFRGQRAGKISFEREGLRGYFAQSGSQREGVAGDAESGSGAANRDGVGLDLYNFAVSGDKAVTLTTATGQGAQNTGPSVAIPYTLKIRSGCEGGGKGALIQTNKSATLSTLNDQHLFQPIAVATQQGGAEISENGICPTVTAAAGMSGNNQPWICHEVDRNILDDQGGQQISIRMDGKAPTLRAEMHGNIPAVMEPVTLEPGIAAREGGHIYEGVCGTLRANAGDNQMAIAYAEGFDRYNQCSTGEVSETLRTPGGGNVPMVMEPIPIRDQATRFSGKRGEKSDGKGNGLGVGEPGDPMNTLTSGDRHAVAYAMQGFGDYKQSNVASGLKARDYKDATDLVAEVAGVDCRNFTEHEEPYPTPQAKPNGGQSLNYSGAVRVRYIVRRLTPTECARLQGFPDNWAHPDIKTELTDEEYAFWLNVRNTHAEINGKSTKEYTRDQMLTWYNKLHTDSSEYKMWGNGIALPCALYVMQGIAEVLYEN